PKRFKILFLCTGNSARSILAEYFLRRLDPVRFEAFSAGAHPRGRVNPLVLEILRDGYHIDARDARSKSWEEFRDVKFDFVVTVCDKARESCPVWPGQPIVAHWGSDDPDAVEGDEEAKKRAVKNVAVEIYRRLGLFTALPIASLDRLRLEEATKSIGMK
ncbi:MAG TPA: arsenate reductase ArsC, partial [Thermoanaerobaculia bacterium]|nr:arsenate reductase ArsC [Thermoanaerobaculia bacterium]